MTTQLSLYNGALRLLGKTKLSALTDAVEARRVLDDAWNDDAVKHCLEQGHWNFATRTQQIEYDSSIEPAFGFRRAFAKPSDWVRTTELSANEYFRPPMTHDEYVDEQSYWFADVDTIYVRYVSDDDAYGNDLSLWPQTFVQYVESYIAYWTAPRLQGAESIIERVEKTMQQRLRDARSKDALNEGVKFPPQTGWVSARRSRFGRRDRGSRSNLTG